MEATDNSQWFIELVEDLGHAIWIEDAAQIRARYVRKQKTPLLPSSEKIADVGNVPSVPGLIRLSPDCLWNHPWEQLFLQITIVCLLSTGSLGVSESSTDATIDYRQQFL